jgi:hypothetical protein
MDVSDPTHPRELGFYDTPGWALGVALSGTLAYLTGDGGLLILRYRSYSVNSVMVPLMLKG